MHIILSLIPFHFAKKSSHIYIYIYMCACVCVCIHIYITHTHTHTYTYIPYIQSALWCYKVLCYEYFFSVCSSVKSCTQQMWQ